MADITTMLANDVATMMRGDRFSLGESRCYPSRSVLRRSVARRLARLGCWRSRDTNTDVMVSGVAVGDVMVRDVMVRDATASVATVMA